MSKQNEYQIYNKKTQGYVFVTVLSSFLNVQEAVKIGSSFPFRIMSVLYVDDGGMALGIVKSTIHITILLLENQTNTSIATALKRKKNKEKRWNKRYNVP